MSRLCWWFVQGLSRLLDVNEGEAARGDLQESGESGGQAVVELLGLVVRRYAAPWMHWQPWAAPLGLAAPFMLLFGGRGVSEPWLGAVGLQIHALWHYKARYQVGLPVFEDELNIVCLCLLLVIWAWAGGYAFGLLARRLAWVHPALLLVLFWMCVFPIAIMLTWGMPDIVLSLIPQVVFLLIPLLIGIYYGSRSHGVSARRAILAALTLAVLTVVAQIGESRAALALDVWSRGESMDSRMVWNPHWFPFAAILWQFGILGAIAFWRGRHAQLQTV